MATTKPRITVTLSPEVYETLSALSNLQERSMSSIVSELLEISHPIQSRVLAALSHAQTVKLEANADFASELDRAQAQAESALAPLLAILDGMALRSSQAASEGCVPPHSNTGVTMQGGTGVAPTEKGGSHE